jgi:hypothetical protein
MDIAGAVKDIEELSGLSYGAKQVVLAARTLLPWVESDGRAVGVSLGGRHRAIKIQGQAGEHFPLQALDYQRGGKLANPHDTLAIHDLQGTGDGGHIGQTTQAQQPLYQWIIPVVVDVPQAPEAQQQMHDEHQNDAMRSKDGRTLQVLEAFLESSFQIQMLKQGQKNNHATKTK